MLMFHLTYIPVPGQTSSVLQATDDCRKHEKRRQEDEQDIFPPRRPHASFFVLVILLAALVAVPVLSRSLNAVAQPDVLLEYVQHEHHYAKVYATQGNRQGEL